MLEIDNLRSALIGPVSLAVARGECVAIRGASGSGKSLLLRAIADLDPNTGTVRLRGEDRDRMSAPAWRRRVALIPAESGWWADRVSDHFEPDTDPTPMLSALGLPDALGWDVDRLSTGERQRIALVRAVCLEPDAMLLDEPTAALDETATSLVEQLIDAERRRGAAVIIVTHDNGQARRIASRHFVMRERTLWPDPELAS